MEDTYLGWWVLGERAQANIYPPTRKKTTFLATSAGGIPTTHKVCTIIYIQCIYYNVNKHRMISVVETKKMILRLVLFSGTRKKVLSMTDENNSDPTNRAAVMMNHR